MPTFSRPSLVWPILIIGLGALLLLEALGYLPGGLWGALAQLWPVALILAGLYGLVGRHGRAGLALVIAAGVLLVAGSLTWAAERATQLPPGGTQTLAPVPGGAARLNADIRMRAGALRLASITRTDLDLRSSFMEGTIQNGPGETARQDYVVAGGEGQLTLEQAANPILWPFLIRRGDTALWDVRLAPGLPLALSVSTGDAAAALDLSGLQLSRLELDSGLGETAVTFPAGQAAQASVRTGLGPVILNLPAGVPVRVTVRSGRARVNVPARLATASGGSASGPYWTPDFDSTQPFLDLEISAGSGGVTVK